MKKKLLTIVSFLLVALSIFSGCADTSTSNLVTFEKTDYYLVDNGKSDFCIVIPEEATIYETTAAEELQLFIQKSTSYKMPIINDSSLDADGFYLSVGETTLYKEKSGISISRAELYNTGVCIKTDDKVVYLVGPTDRGTLNAVYTFLNFHIGFKAYATDHIKFDYKTSIKLLNVNYKHKPSVETTLSTGKEFTAASKENIIANARMFTIPAINGGLTLNGKEFTMWCHTNDFIIEKPALDKIHPDWFSSHDYTACQLCYSNEEMIEHFSKTLITKYIIGKTEPYYMLGCNDNVNCCDCDDCREGVRLYGSQGGIYVRFMNKVAEYIETYFEENNIERELLLVGLMYYAYDDAPVIENEDGTYSPYHPSVVPDNKGQVTVGVCMTPIDACYTHAFNDPNCERNKSYYKDWKGWASLTDELYTYGYASNFATVSTHFNTWSSYAENFKMYEELGLKNYYEQMSGTNYYNSLSTLRGYIRASLGWDADQDVYELIKEFIKEYYGIASGSVQEYFDGLMEQFEYIYQKNNNACHAYNTSGFANSTSFPLQSLRSLENKLKTGMNVIENSLLSKEEKEKYIERIEREYALIKVEEYRFNSAFFTDEEYQELIEYIEDAKVKFGITSI